MPIEPDRIKAICFDVDGTLHDTDDQFVLRLAKWLQPFRFLLHQKDTLALARAIVMRTETPASFVYGLPDRLGLDAKISLVNDWIYELGLGKRPQPYQLIDGVVELLEGLQGKYLMSVVSARGDRSTQHFLETFKIKEFFQVIVTAQTCSHTKPFPDPVLWAAKQMGVPVENCLMVGDTTVDILAGKAAGAQTAGVLCGFGEASELASCGADIILPTTINLQKVLLEN